MNRHIAILILLGAWAIGMVLQAPYIRKSMSVLNQAEDGSGCHLPKFIVDGFIIGTVIAAAFIIGINPLHSPLLPLITRFMLAGAFGIWAAMTTVICQRFRLDGFQVIVCLIAPARVLRALAGKANPQAE